MRIRTLLPLGLLLLSFTVQAQSDVAGSRDPLQLPRFPLSWIVSFDEQQIPEYELATGPMRKLEGVIAPEQSKVIKGDLTRITYRVSDIHTPEQVFRYYLELLGSLKANILFQCSSRQCGSSNQWANNYFEVAELYGIDRTQFFVSASLGNLQLALYTVQRGNRRSYVQLDLIQPLQQSADTLATDIKQRGFSWLNEPDSAEPLLDYMMQNPTQQVLIGSYNKATGVSLEEQLQQSTRAAQAFIAMLTGAGIDPARIATVPVGPALPVDAPLVSGLWVQLR
ncbi:DUF4892 domain-containing protein [Amphritea sp.]|uniref:DUF4892 domain-containing protein n=1 Tax=Amphritea sp. TaxID=1872502 RepID=UPI003A920CBF